MTIYTPACSVDTRPILDPMKQNGAVPRLLIDFCLCFWCPYMAINVSVQYNGGFPPDIILLTLCDYHRGIRSNDMKRFCLGSLCSYVDVSMGCSEGLDAFRYIFKQSQYY